MHYCDVFNKYLDLKEREFESLPEIDTSHLIKMTDNFGLTNSQFRQNLIRILATHLTIMQEQFLVCTKHYEKFREFKQLDLIRTYLNYIKYVQKKTANCTVLFQKIKASTRMSGVRMLMDRAIWALGYLISSPNIPDDFKREAESIIRKAIAASDEIGSPRSLAFIIQGLYFYNENCKFDKNKKIYRETCR